MARKALGKGLSALIGSSVKNKKDKKSSQVSIERANDDKGTESAALEIDLSAIKPCDFQPRKNFDEQSIEQLCDSMRVHGLIQPLVLRQSDSDGKVFEIVAGERRYLAAKRLNFKKVPAIIRKADDMDLLEIALVENLQREDLNPLEEAEAYAKLAKDFNLTQNEIARKVGKSRPQVANSMRLLELHPELKKLLVINKLSFGHAKVLLALKDESEQKFAADIIVNRDLSVRKAEKLIEQIQLKGIEHNKDKTQLEQEVDAKQMMKLETTQATQAAIASVEK